MKPSELEAKVLGIIERVARKQPTEDSVVELKAEWIDAKQAGRRLAALCNAARGEPVLWIVGLDEVRGVTGAKHEELANWWPQVRSAFDQLAPDLVQNVAIPSGELTVVALLFETSRAPFVTKNPSGGPISLEVPWREGNATRSARREDLLRLLLPVMKMPELEVVSAHAVAFSNSKNEWRFNVSVKFYVVVRSQTVLVAHRSLVEVDPDQLDCRDGFYRCGFDTSSPEGVAATEHDVVLARPGVVEFKAHGPMAGEGPILPPKINVAIRLGVLDVFPSPSVSLTLLCSKRTPQRTEYLLPLP